MHNYQRKFEQSQRRHTPESESTVRAQQNQPQGTDGVNDSTEQQCLDMCPICRAADLLRASLPAETREQFHAIQRETLLAVRALLDHYIERTVTAQNGSAPIQDIPIE